VAKGFKFFEFASPGLVDTKASIKLSRTDFIKADVQLVGPGGSNNLHTHTGNDGFWLVLSGRVRFYGEGPEPVAELGPMQGALVPHGTRYWFESGSDEQLELLHVSARTNAREDKRVDFTEKKDRPASSSHPLASVNTELSM
jgi:mannose-6-phosphate isomerase-like protein (cupin superfamily)